LKEKIKAYKSEMKLLLDDNIQKDNNLQRMIHQVERFKRGLQVPDDGEKDAEIMRLKTKIKKLLKEKEPKS
jgi:predicted secreted Zn-dependent protease